MVKGRLSARLSCPEALQQFAVDAAKAAVAENAHDLASLRFAGHVRHDRIHIRQISG
jgi:hypothetical protein